MTPMIAKSPETIGKVLRSPLIQKEGGVKGSPLGSTASESLTESIRKEQLEFRELMLKASATSSTTVTVPIPNSKPPGIEMSRSQKKNKKKKVQEESY